MNIHPQYSGSEIKVDGNEYLIPCQDEIPAPSTDPLLVLAC